MLFLNRMFYDNALCDRDDQMDGLLSTLFELNICCT